MFKATQINNISLDIRKFITIPSFAKNVLNSMTSSSTFSFRDPVVRSFLRENLRGGRV
jgi:hypothetical protein